MSQQALKNTKARNRKAMDPTVPKTITSAIVSTIVATASDTIRITFAARVMARGLPAFRAGAAGAETVQSVTAITGSTLELVFTGSVVTTSLVVPESDPTIRTQSGGFVRAGTYEIPGIVP